MKPTALSPGAKSLARGSTFAAPRRSLKRTRRSPRPRPTELQITARDQAAERGECWLAKNCDVDTPCEGPWELAHLLPAERLRFNGIPADQVWSPSVVRAACARHHRAFDAHRLTLPRSAIPAETECFASEYGLVGLLDRTYGVTEREEAA